MVTRSIHLTLWWRRNGNFHSAKVIVNFVNLTRKCQKAGFNVCTHKFHSFALTFNIFFPLIDSRKLNINNLIKAANAELKYLQRYRPERCFANFRLVYLINIFRVAKIVSRNSIQCLLHNDPDRKCKQFSLLFLSRINQCRNAVFDSSFSVSSPRCSCSRFVRPLWGESYITQYNLLLDP